MAVARHPPGHTLPSRAGGRRVNRGVCSRSTAETGRGESVIQSDPAAPLEDPFKGRAGAHDYRALPGRPEVAVFETPPFTAPHEIVGRVVAELAVSASVPDFDVWVQLYDVAPDGTAWNLSSPGTGLPRASYRDGGPERHPVPDGEVVRLRLDRMVTANRFLPGHRLRIVVSTAFFPLFSVNPQTGRQEFESADTRAGEVRIHHAPGEASLLILPMVPLSPEDGSCHARKVPGAWHPRIAPECAKPLHAAPLAEAAEVIPSGAVEKPRF